jgi:glycosyltransferase involved in cell wall biosynthesis
MLTSIVIPCYNRPELLAECLASLEEADGDFEIIVVDDGSEEDIRGVAAPHRFVRLEENRGTSAARNAGLEVIRGEAVIFFDSDDLALPGLVDIRAAELKAAESNVGGIFGGYYRNNAGQMRVMCSPYLGTPADYRRLCQNQTVPFPGTIWRREVAERVRFDETLRAAEDWEFILGVAEAGYQILRGEGSLWVWRHGPWERHTGSEDQLRCLDIIRERRAGAKNRPPDIGRATPRSGPVNQEGGGLTGPEP